MARMHSRKKGKSGSKKPPVKRIPRWLKIDKEKVENLVVKLAKERYSSAQIGLILRDQYGIPDVKTIVGKSIAQIMKENKVYPQFPEDLMDLFRRVVKLDEHLKRHRKDKHSRRGFKNLESKIRRLVKYYKRKKMIPEDFVYDIERVKLIVQK